MRLKLTQRLIIAFINRILFFTIFCDNICCDISSSRNTSKQTMLKIFKYKYSFLWLWKMKSLYCLIMFSHVLATFITSLERYMKDILSFLYSLMLLILRYFHYM